MPIYDVTDPTTGQTAELTGDSPPTEQELETIFQQVGTAVPQSTNRVTQRFTEQFGPTSPVFNPLSPAGQLAGFAGAAGEQPGASLPFVGQVAGGLLGQTIGGSVSGATGGVLGAILGEGLREGIGSSLGRVIGHPQSYDVLGQLVRTGKTAATVEAMGLGLGSLLDRIMALAPLGANRLMNSLLKPKASILRKTPMFGAEATEVLSPSTKTGLLKQAEELIQRNEAQLQQILHGRSETVNLGGLQTELKALAENVIDATDKKTILKVSKDLLKVYKGKKVVSVADANILKRKIFDQLKEAQYGTNRVPAKTKAMKVAGHYLRTAIEGALPDEPIHAINRNLQLGGQIHNSLQNLIAAGQRTNPLGLSDLLYSALGGALIGDSALSRAAGAFGAASIARGLMSTPSRSFAAKTLVGIGSLRPTVEAGLPVARGLATQAVSALPKES